MAKKKRHTKNLAIPLLVWIARFLVLDSFKCSWKIHCALTPYAKIKVDPLNYFIFDP